MAERQVVSNHNPPFIRDALVEAAKARDYKEIDRIVDEAVKLYPEMFLPRQWVRAEFAPRAREVVSA